MPYVAQVIGAAVLIVIVVYGVMGLYTRYVVNKTDKENNQP